MGVPHLRQRIVSVHKCMPVPKRKGMGSNMRLIDADALVTVGQMIMIVGFFGFIFGFLVTVCGWMIGDIL